MKDRLYGDIAVGEQASFKRLISEEDIEAFAKLTGDRNPLHLDEQYAASTRFQQRIAHGLLAQSLFSTIAGMYLPGKHSLILSLQSQFRQPVHIGDTLTVRGAVDRKVDVGKLLVLALTIENQKGTKVIEGTMTVQVLQ